MWKHSTSFCKLLKNNNNNDNNNNNNNNKVPREGTAKNVSFERSHLKKFLRFPILKVFVRKFFSKKWSTCKFVI